MKAVWTVVVLSLVVPLNAGASDGYTQTVELLKAEREKLVQRWSREQTQAQREAIIAEATERVQRAVVDELIPAWYGTPWDFNGTSATPGEGHIACGYLVSTVLRHAGFRVQRYKLAQQASEKIVRTLVAPTAVRTWSTSERATVLEDVRKSGPGVYVVGLDIHVGFLIHEGERLDFCHSSYVHPAVVKCSPAAEDPAFHSNYWVVGRILEPSMVRAWLFQQPILVK